MPRQRKKARIASPEADPTDVVASSSTYVDPRSAPVPLPTGELRHLGQGSHRRSRKGQAKQAARASADAAKRWKRTVPTFRVDVDIETLSARKKNNKKDRARAEARVAAMRSAPADAGSMIIVDTNGKPLVAVFAHAMDGPTVESDDGYPLYPGPAGRTLEDVTDDMYYDGLGEVTVSNYHWQVQVLAAYAHPVAHRRDIRHRDQAVMAYPKDEGDRNDDDGKSDSGHYEVAGYEDEEGEEHIVDDDDEVAEGGDKEVAADKDEGAWYPDQPGEYEREGLLDDSTPQQFERTGVIHVIHCWCQQGKPKGPMTPSRDMCNKSCRSTQAVKNYFRESQDLALEIKVRFEVAFPLYFPLYTQAFAAGQWEEADPGPFLGRALVWKLQVEAHQDGLDEGPAAIFPFGHFTGRELHLPDLGLKIAYRPRDLVILLAGALYHAVEKWSPIAPPANAGTTAGRASSVFFFPHKSFVRLQGKAPGWNVRTMSGELNCK